MADESKKKKKKPNGKGTFCTTDGGKLEYRFYYTDEYGDKKRKSVTGKNKRECYFKADQWAERMEMLRSGVDPEATIPSILYERYHSDYKKNYVREQGYGRNLDSVKRIENSIIGSIPIAELRPHEIDLFLRSMTKYSNSSITKIYRQRRLSVHGILQVSLNEKI